MSKLLLLALTVLVSAPNLFAQEDTGGGDGDVLRLIVSSSADDANARDANPGDGICSDDNDRCTLRAAIDEANAATGRVVIVLPGRLPGGNTGTYTSTRVAPNMMANTFEDDNAYGDFDLNGSFTSLTIQGTGTPGPQITSSPNDRIFDVAEGATVTFQRLWITGGTAQAGDNGSPDGSGVGVDGESGANGGGMRIGMNATVDMDQVTFSGNFTQSGGNGAAPATTIDRTKGGKGGDGGDGGALFISTGATVTINRGTFIGNGTGDAGSPASGQANPGRSDADGGDGGNGGNGGAIYNAGTLTLRNSTIFNNTNGSPSSGLPGVGNGEQGALGEGGSGGGIANARRNVQNNVIENEGTVTLENTIVAGNAAGDDTGNGSQPGNDLFDGSNGSTFTLTGSNLISTNNFVTDLTGDLIGTVSNNIDPMITGQNQNSDEAVPTAVLASGSPAVDAGTNTGGEFNFDARGFERVAGSSADIGAYELDATAPEKSLKIVEIDVQASNDNLEFTEIRNTGNYPVQMDAYVLVGFNSGGTACFVANLYGELTPGQLFTVGDMEVDYNVEQPLGFDVLANNCGNSEANNFADDNGAVALYKGDGGNFTGIMAGSKSEEREDVIVYAPSSNNTSARGVMMDLCGAFGQSAGCAASDTGDNSSIQVDEDGNTFSGEPSPGSNNVNASLPVELISFSGASPKAGVVELYWSTELERNNDGFSVERAEAGNWVEATWVAGMGNSDELRSYATTLTNVPTGQQAFRLRQRDFDGTEAFSDIVTVYVDALSGLSMFPNPTSGLLTLTQGEAPAGRYEISILDVSGRLLRTGNVTLRTTGVLRTDVDASELPAAPYYLRVVGPTGVTTLPFAKR